MRHLLLFLVTTTLCAESVEQYTLKDGRVVVGTYDHNTRTMTVYTGSIKANIPVHPLDIIKREVATLPTNEPKEIARKEKPITSKKATFDAYIKEYRAKEQALRDQLHALDVEYSGKVLGILATCKEVEEIEDPRASEMVEVNKRRAFNVLLMRILKSEATKREVGFLRSLIHSNGHETLGAYIDGAD